MAEKGNIKLSPKIIVSKIMELVSATSSIKAPRWWIFGQNLTKKIAKIDRIEVENRK